LRISYPFKNFTRGSSDSVVDPWKRKIHVIHQVKLLIIVSESILTILLECRFFSWDIFICIYDIIKKL